MTTLRTAPGEAATADPKVLNSTVSSFYGGVWKEAEDGAQGDEVGRYLRGYDKRFNLDLVGAVPSREQVETRALDTNDSCAGPCRRNTFCLLPG